MDRLRTECNFEFRGGAELEQPDRMAGKKIKITLECRGTDIIGRYSSLIL